MTSALIGLIVLVATGFLFWNVAPRDGVSHRIVRSAGGTLVGVAITSGIGIGLAMVVAGVASLFS